jgi:hypothetical protein
MIPAETMTRYSKYLMITAFLALSPVSSVFSETAVAEWKYREVEVVDTPTADVVDHYGYNVSFRFGKDGALQAKTLFGVFPRLNLGFSLDGERMIGTEDARLNKPTLNVKFRMFDGPGVLPALAIGYDGQGYYFDRTLDEYTQKEKGLFLVATKEILVSNLMFNVGVNNYDLEEGDSTRCFTALSYNYLQTVGLMLELDHFNEFDKERRVNFGLKYFVTPVFTVDVIGRNVPEVPRSVSRETERIVRLSYTGSF